MDKELEQIINQLIIKTNKGEVKWNKSDTPNEFRLLLDSGRITTRLYSIKNSMGLGSIQKVECIIDNQRGDVVLRGNSSVDSEDGNLLYSLYDAAFRSYTGKDDVIKSILGQLSSGETIGVDEDSLPF